MQQSGLAEADITTRAQSNTLQTKLLWLFPILLVTWVHYPVVAGGFYADDCVPSPELGYKRALS